MPSAAEIQAYLSANPGMSDADIAAAMNQYGVSTADMAAATGSNVEDIQSRYDAVTPAVAEPVYEPAADPYQPVAETPAPAVTSPFVSAFSPSNFVEPVDEPPPVSGGITSLAPQAPAVPEQAPIVGAGITSLAPQAETPPVVQPEGILSGIDQVGINSVNSPVKPTDQEIVKFLTDNPNTTDAQIAKIMQDTGLNPADIARATGSKVEDVTSRYEAATAPAAPTGIATLAAPPVETPPPTTPAKPSDAEIVKFLTDNPKVSDADIAKIMDNTGLKPEDIARATGSKVEDVTARYEAASPTGIATLPSGKTSPVTEAPKTPVLPPVDPVVSAAPEIKYGKDQYTKTQVTDYIGTVMNDTKLAPWEKTNKIMESAQKAGMTTDDLKAIYGKDVVDPYLKDYGAGIKSYITETLSDPKKSDFEKLAAINQASEKYGLDPKEISSYAGMNEKGVQKVFDSFETGLKSIVTNLSAPTVSDIDKTKGALQLQSKYGITDDQIAKALGGNLTGKDVKAYLDPVKNFAPKFQEITADNTKTASDIRSFIDDAKKDPRISGLYGLAIQNAEKMLPVLGLRDSMAGKGTPEELTKGYTDFVAAVNADPALKEKYGAQADAIDKVAKMSQRIADEQFGGKLQPHMFQTFIGLDQKTLGDVPKTLEMTPGETQTVTDNEGNTQTYTTPGTLKDTKGYEPVYNITGSGENETRELSGYTKPVKTSAGVTVDAQYDAKGNLTGYRGRPEDKVWPAHRVGVTGVWDAEGKAKPEQKIETPGFAKSMLQDIQALGPIGQLIIAAGTGGLGSLAAGALQSSLGPMLAKAVGSGLVSGAMSEIGGGKFGKGFLTGAIGNPLEALTQNLVGSVMPNIDTGNATLNEYVGKALPNLASSTAGALINKKDVGDAAFGSLLNTGTNMATSSLINSAMPDTLTPDVKNMFTGVSGQLLSDLLKGQTPDVQKAVMGTIMKNAMSSGKDTAKSTAKGKTMGDDEINFGDLNSGEGAFDISSLLGGDSSGVDLSGIDLGPEAFDISSLLGGGEGTDLSALDMGPEAFNIDSLVDNFDNFSLEEGQGTQNASDLLDSFSLEEGQGTQDASDLYDSFSLEGDQGFKFDDDTEPGSSGGTQGSEGAAGEGDLGSYKGSSYDTSGGTKGTGGKKLVFDDDKEPGSSGGTGGSTGVAKKDDLGSYKGSTYDTSGGKKTAIDDKGNVILPDGTKVTPGGTVTPPGPTTPTPKTPTTPTKPDGKKDNNMLMMLLALMAMMNKGGGGKSTGSGGTIPMLSANRTQLPYGPVSGGPAARPGAGGVNYFSPTTYTPKAAGGGLMSLAGGGMSNLGSYSDGGRLLKGPGDGVSDSIPATIGGKQPARLATGEFVVPARIVSELGNGSTEAGAKKLYAMMDRVQKARRKTKNVAADTKAQKYLPA